MMIPHNAHCSYCHDHVRPMRYCPECGLYGPNEEDY